MQKKKAIITVERVYESIEDANEKIMHELIKWVQAEAISVPRVKKSDSARG